MGIGQCLSWTVVWAMSKRTLARLRANPYLGAFRASAEPLEQVLAVMGKE